MWQAFVLAFAITAAVDDVLWRKIPRQLTVGGLLAGLAYHAFHGGFLSALATSALGFGVGLGLYELRAIGGGDVKLITSMGAILGFQPWMLALEVAIGVAALMALAGILHRGIFLQTIFNMGRLLKHFFVNGLRPHPDIQVTNPGLLRIPFGVAAALGIICTVVVR
jgi:prepilin peptidase CpaA